MEDLMDAQVDEQKADLLLVHLQLLEQLVRRVVEVDDGRDRNEEVDPLVQVSVVVGQRGEELRVALRVTDVGDGGLARVRTDVVYHCGVVKLPHFEEAVVEELAVLHVGV
eukprot:CAMPEP_0168618764 /NCGR_PEP_ID=MMETSP0449_2-20121227/6244_1 /TAXON_ID=1082188 /ORGANISM="Strombidium rassoulzadegani, Strain ras09" /LENGTH=109 /DNA_ID=CAMNT_0008659657 /DNA_START=435 /DNA_END=764 /DNA_ORIENTATION=+